MKKVWLNIYRFIVGFKYGFTGKGNEQWYYFLALVMNCMLTWRFKSDDYFILYTIVSTAHYFTVVTYGYLTLEEYSVWYSIIYYLIHLTILIICIIFDWKWTLLTATIVIVGYFLAPDCTGNNIFMRPPKLPKGYYLRNDNTFAILMFHSIWFTIFVIIALSLPTALWVRLIIIIVCMALHPIIDYLEGGCTLISDVTEDSFWKIAEKIKEDKEV